MKKETIIQKKIIYNGKLFKLVKYEVEISGGKFTREIIEHPGAVVILPLKEDKKVVMIKQFRTAIGKKILELPAGTLENDENEHNCASRELQEETGYIANKIEKIFEFFVAPGYSNERISVFIATGLRIAGKKTEADESIEVIEIKLNEAINMICNGSICDGKTITVLSYFQLMHK